MLRRANLSEEQKDKSLEHIENQCAWLERLVQTLLKLFVKKQEIQKEEIAISTLFERVRETTAALLLQRSVKLVMRHSVETLLCNAELMQDLLVNLVDNAAKAYDEKFRSAYGHPVLHPKDHLRGRSREWHPPRGPAASL